MFRRLLASLVLVWALGFVVFAIALPGPAGDERTDGVVVLTGGTGRIQRALDVLDKGWARKLLVAGVDKEVRPKEFAREYGVSAKAMACCVTLGYQSVDTQSNATEAKDWIARNTMASVRLVTTDWHMRRARADLAAEVPASVRIVTDAVPSQPSLRILFLEYNKLIARTIWQMLHRWKLLH
ncbi:MAG: YdcF family protein [Sphingomonadales bacterium]|nr:YdcF family protein [Sphingomonadales bacterium]MDE2567992.1 YdcF family protein [Sphingomonadales bacterium]